MCIYLSDVSNIRDQINASDTMTKKLTVPKNNVQIFVCRPKNNIRWGGG